MRTVIFGVDGLTFRILHPLIERGDLPNFRRLAEEGCAATLESKYPPLTPPAWLSLSTGLKPARHGVYDFWGYEEPEHPGEAPRPQLQTKRKAGKAIWNILSEYGKQVLVVNVPATYPPEPVNGVMISGYLTPSTEVDFTYPASFKEELFRVAPNYEIDLDHHAYELMKVSGKVGPIVDATLRMTEQRITLIKHLMTEKPWDFCYMAFIGSDRLQHPIWEEIMSLDTQATAYYRLLDDMLGWVLDQLTPDDCLFVISDHGFQGHHSYFDINEYLYSKGLLALGPSVLAQRRKESRSSTLKYLVNRLGLLSVARKIKRSLKSSGVIEHTEIDVGRPLLDDIDWEHTLASVPSFSGFQGGYADIVLGDTITQEQIDELCEDLKRQKDPKNGQPLVDAIYTTEVFGTGPYAPKEKHLLVLPNDGITFRVKLGNKRIWEDLGKAFGSHQKDGVLYAYGQGIKRGFKAPNAELYDLVPTVLRSMGLPFPETFDGRVLEELFIEDTKKEQATADAAPEAGRARRKLKKLLEA